MDTSRKLKIFKSIYYYIFLLRKKTSSSSSRNDVDYKISLVSHHHPTIRPILLEIVTMAKAPATPFSLLTPNPYALCINFSVSSFLEICLGVKVSPIWQHVTLRPLAPSPHSPKEFWTLKPNYSLKKQQHQNLGEKRERKWAEAKYTSRESSRRAPSTNAQVSQCLWLVTLSIYKMTSSDTSFQQNGKSQ